MKIGAPNSHRGRLNAMTPDLLGDLAKAVGEMTADADVRALVVTGAGRGFCLEQTLKAVRGPGENIVAGVPKSCSA